MSALKYDDTYQLMMQGIHKSYGGVSALKDVSLNVKPGEIHALMGENGAGKSTLIKVLSGAEKADSGAIHIRGKKVHISGPKDGIANGVSVIYQEFALVPDLSVAENIFIDEFRNQHALVSFKQLNKRASEFLDEIGFGNINPAMLVGELTTAYQQVIEICKALSRNAHILVLDEPTAVLTNKEVEQLFVLLNRLRDKGVSIIYISHRLEEVFRLGDRVTVLKDGRYVDTKEMADIDQQQLVNMMIGRNLDDYFPKRQSNIGKLAMKVEHLKAGRMVRDVSFDVHEGEVVGLSGLVGSGRTEAIRAMLGVDKLDSGKVTLGDKEVRITSPKKAFSIGVGMLSEDRKHEGVVLTMPIKYNISLSCLKRFCSKVGGIISRKKEDQFTLDFAQKVSLRAASLMDEVNTLSGGNQQKVGIARLLASGCKVMILDEPTRGVDVGAKIEIFNIINEMVAQNYAVVIISSEMAEVIGMCDRAFVIREGVSVGVLQKDELSEQNIINYVMGVTADV
ncbi:MAG: sugar ABC transporter ATP-binding protein [Oscillospiraceae bacterium]|nr:sugar ABC transporter ATP-binding protein [Oscillospiraceae bacterium]